MDWEYPGVRVGHRVEDRENFATLLKVLKEITFEKRFLKNYQTIELSGNAGRV